jgi:hypothetical protein
MIDQKEAVRDVVRGYLEESHPERVTEFDSTFNVTYSIIERQSNGAAQSEASLEEAAISFDASAVDSALVALACSVALAFIKAALKDIAKRDLPQILDKVEAKLAEITNHPELVSAIRKRVQGILQEL